MLLIVVRRREDRRAASRQTRSSDEAGSRRATMDAVAGFLGRVEPANSRCLRATRFPSKRCALVSAEPIQVDRRQVGPGNELGPELRRKMISRVAIGGVRPELEAPRDCPRTHTAREGEVNRRSLAMIADRAMSALCSFRPRLQIPAAPQWIPERYPASATLA